MLEDIITRITEYKEYLSETNDIQTFINTVLYNRDMNKKQYVINKTVKEMPTTDNETLAQRELQVRVYGSDAIRNVHVWAISKKEEINTHVIVGVDATSVFIQDLGYWVRVHNKTGDIERIEH